MRILNFLKSRKILVFILLILNAYIPENVYPVPSNLRIVPAIIIVAVWLLFEFPALRVNLAKQYFKNGKFEKGWKAVELVRKSHLPISRENKIYIISVYVQYAENPAPGVAMIEKQTVKKRYKKDFAFFVMLSLYYFRERKNEEAEKILKTLLENGANDQSIYINLITFLFQQRKFDEGRTYFDRVDENLPLIQDLFGMSLMEQGRMEEAYRLYCEMLDAGNATFPEVLLHAAQTKLYYMRDKEAKNLLEKIKSAYFVKTSRMTSAFVSRLINDVSSTGTRMKVNSNPVSVMLAEDYGHNENEREWKKPSAEELKKIDGINDFDDIKTPIEE